MPPKRSSRRSAIATAASTPRRASTRATRQAKSPTPQPDPVSSEEEQEEEEAPPERSDDEAQSQQDGEAEDEAPGQPEGEVAGSDVSEQPVIVPRRRPGRPPKVRPPGWDAGDADGNESGTPARRGRRGGWRGGPRGRGKRGGGIPITKPPVDEDGNEMEVVDDEVVHPTHSEGEKKVDTNGHLQDAREYRVRTFSILGRGDRLYMLSTEPARCTGYRDSYLFFSKHKYLYKIIIGEEEKKDLIERDILPHSYKGRTIGVVTARSVYREFGSKIVVGGKKVVDDYDPDAARARGDVEGELADPFDRVPDKGQSYNRNQYVAWHGASNVYHTNAPVGQGAVAQPSLAHKKRGAITSANWMYEHARQASIFNSNLAVIRKNALDGVYDTHTNLMHFPQIMQPTHAVWEQGPEAINHPPNKKRKIEQVNGHGPALTNGVYKGDVEMSDARVEPVREGLMEPSSFLKRNYLIVDTELLTPQHATWAPPDYRKRPHQVPQMDDDDAEFDFDGIADAGLRPAGLPSLPDDVLDSFPAEAREAYLQERKLQTEWQGLWSDQGAVRKPKIGIASMITGG